MSICQIASGDELTPIERDANLAADRCPDCGQPVTDPRLNEEWCVACTRPVEPYEQHPTNKPPEMRLRVENRFWEKVEIAEKDQCWEWTAATAYDGYGRFKLGDKAVLSHRLALALNRGLTNPDHLDCEVVRHTCDNPVCCNPAHLLPGTHQQNMIDAAVRSTDRQLSPHDVRTIRRRSANGDYYHEIAEDYPVSTPFIGEIVRRESYAWVE